MNSARLCHNFSSICRFTKRIKKFISSVGVLIITAGWYTGPATMIPSLPTNGMPAHHRWFQYHRRMVRWTGIPSVGVLHAHTEHVRYAYRTRRVSVSRAGFPLQLLQSYHWLIIELGLIVRCVLQTL